MARNIFTKITLAEPQEGEIIVQQKMVHWRTGETWTEEAIMTPEQAAACKVPPRRQELQLDMNEIAKLQAWREELMRRFGH